MHLTLGKLLDDENGITGLETAIVLIAFVVVASVFAFAVLSTGLLGSEKSKEATIEALEQTAATVAIRGSVIATATSSLQTVESVKFTLTSIGDGAEPVSMFSAATIMNYIDTNQFVKLDSTQWSTNWLIGSGPLIDPNEQVDVTVTLNGLSPLLATSTDFTIELKPERGAVVSVDRTTPPELHLINDLN